MVTRRAIIIGSPGGYRDLDLLKGVEVDIKNYKSFLLSKAGGEWYESEILILDDPDYKTVTESISQISQLDYSFIVFTGHGFINSFTKSDYICLKDEDISIEKLISKSEKQILIIDACREYYTRQPSVFKFAVNESTSLNNKQSTRSLFDKAIDKTPNGIILVYSTQPNESAGDDEKKGGHFSFSLIKTGYDWWECKENQKILTLESAVKISESILKQTFFSKQRPIMGGQIRRLTFPPFAISSQKTES